MKLVSGAQAQRQATGHPTGGYAGGHNAGLGPAPSDYATQRDKIIRRMCMVARARFAANKRLEAKAAATNFGLQTVNLYTIAIGILLLQYTSADIVTGHSRSLSFISLIASVFVQIIALIETYKDYSGKARSMYDCAIEVTRISQELELDQRADWGLLAHYQSRYHAAIKDFDVNHDELDFVTAQIEPARQKTRSWSETRSLLWWRTRYLWNIYAFTFSILVLPWACFFILAQLGLQ
jgi:SMODS and SLOG-associating 2TM effector domain family 5